MDVHRMVNDLWAGIAPLLLFRPPFNGLGPARAAPVGVEQCQALLMRMRLPAIRYERRRTSPAWWTISGPRSRRCCPRRAPHPKGGRPFVDDRAALCAILLVLWTGAPWRAVPRGPGTVSPTTAWRRLRDWQAAGVWDAALRALLDRAGSADVIGWNRVCVDSASIPAKRGAPVSAPTPSIAPNPGSGSLS